MHGVCDYTLLWGRWVSWGDVAKKIPCELRVDKSQKMNDIHKKMNKKQLTLLVGKIDDHIHNVNIAF